jgi:hypothetical protein
MARSCGTRPIPALARGAAGGDLETGDLGLARVGLQQSGDHRDGGGLAGAVGPEQPVGLPGRDANVDTLHRDEVVEGLAQPGGVQNGIVSGFPHQRSTFASKL